MAARRNNRGKITKTSEGQARFSTPLKKRLVKAFIDLEEDVSIAPSSAGFRKEESNLILDVNSDRKLSKAPNCGGTTLSSPSILSHSSSTDHSKKDPVGYCDNHSIQGHPGQSFKIKDISLKYDQQSEAKPQVSYGPHSIFHPMNHSTDNSDRHNAIFCYDGTNKQSDLKRWDENVWKEESKIEELKLTSSHVSENMDQITKESCFPSPKNRCQEIKNFDSGKQTIETQIFKWQENVGASNTQGKSAYGLDSRSTCLSMTSFDSQVNKNNQIDESHRNSDVNVTSPFKRDARDGQQLTKFDGKEKKQTTVMEVYICSQCKKEFRQSGNFQNHMKSHTGCPNCKCGNCGLIFDSGEKLIQHMQNEHTGSNPYKCEHCDRDFSQLNNLRRHMHVHKEKTLKCEFCDRKFSEYYYLKMHLGSHTGRRTFKCGVCTAKFTSSRELKDHVSKHPLSKLQVCEVCKKFFSKACVLRQHKKSHTGNRPYKCEQCHKTFIHRHHLTMHMRSHTNSKPFTCETCGKEFSQTSHLNKHKRQHLIEAKWSKSSCKDSNSGEEKVINTLGNNYTPDELNGEPSNLQKKPRVKANQKRSKVQKKKDIPAATNIYLHRASQISEANPFHTEFSDPSMFGPSSNEAGQNVMNQMTFPLPNNPTHYKTIYMASPSDLIAASLNNWYMMSYLSLSGNNLGNNNAEDLSLPKRNHFSCASHGPLFPMKDSSPTVNSTRKAPVTSTSIYQGNNQYFHTSNFARPEFSDSNMPIQVCLPVDLSLPTAQRSKYGSVGENDVEDLSSRGSLSSNSPYATCSVSSQPDNLPYKHELGSIDFLKLTSPSIINSPKADPDKADIHKIENDEFKFEKPVLYAKEEKKVEDRVSQPEISSVTQYNEVMEISKHENQKENIDAMIDDDDDDDEGRLTIVEEDTEIQAHNSRTYDGDKAEIKKAYSGVSQNFSFTEKIKHDWEGNKFRREKLQVSQIGLMSRNKSFVSGSNIQGIYEVNATNPVSSNLHWNGVMETFRGHNALETNNPHNVFQPAATLRFQRVVTECYANDSSGIAVDLSMKISTAKKQQYKSSYQPI